MRTSRQLGGVSVGLYFCFWAIAVVPHTGGNIAEPLQVVALVLCGVLGYMAARSGSKWWLLMPGLVVATIGVLATLATLALRGD